MAKPTQANAPVSTDAPGVSNESIQGIAGAVNTLTEAFGKTYERLNYPGFVSVLGAILVCVPLVLSKTPIASISFEEQRLYVTSGVAFVLIAAVWITIQNWLVYKLQRAKQDVACRMLAIKVAAMGETQRAALSALVDVNAEQLNDDPFAKK